MLGFTTWVWASSLGSLQVKVLFCRVKRLPPCRRALGRSRVADVAELQIQDSPTTAPSLDVHGPVQDGRCVAVITDMVSDYFSGPGQPESTGKTDAAPPGREGGRLALASAATPRGGAYPKELL